MTNHTRTEEISGDFFYICGHPSQAGNRYDNENIWYSTDDDIEEPTYYDSGTGWRYVSFDYHNEVDLIDDEPIDARSIETKIYEPLEGSP